jgi:hypothetical protein
MNGLWAEALLLFYLILYISIGYRALLAKKSGMINAWPSPMKRSLVFMMEATKMEMAANPPEIRNNTRNAARI